MFNLTIDKIQITAGNGFPCKQMSSINGDQFVALVKGIVKHIMNEVAQEKEHEEEQPDKTQEEEHEEEQPDKTQEEEQGGNPSGEPDSAEE